SDLGSTGIAVPSSYRTALTVAGAAGPLKIPTASSTPPFGACTPEPLGAIFRGPMAAGKPFTTASDVGVAMVPGPKFLPTFWKIWNNADFWAAIFGWLTPRSFAPAARRLAPRTILTKSPLWLDLRLRNS